MSGGVAAVEALYEAVVTNPERWNEQMFIDWTDSVDADGPLSGADARHIRRALRVAQRLQAFWTEARDRQDLVWESRVDLAFGPRAWRPVLGLAENELARTRTNEAFVDVARLFPLVNGEDFLDDIDFEAWSQLQS